MTPRGVKDFAARLAGSGIAAGAIASRHIAMLCGFQNSIGLDMGGTICDVSLAYEGQSRVTKDWFVEFGYPIRFPSIEVLTIGAGGGSLAWIDEAGGCATARNRPAPILARPATATATRSPPIPTPMWSWAGSARTWPAARSCSTPSWRREAVRQASPGPQARP